MCCVGYSEYVSKMKPKRKPTTVLVPAPVRWILAKMANADHRSMQGEVEWLIEQEAIRRADAVEASVKGIGDANVALATATPARPEPAAAQA